MTDIIKKIQSQPNFYAMTGTTQSQIEQAEKALGIMFSNEYREYLIAFGTASFSGHEFTGICKSSRLNVADVTTYERTKNPTVPLNLYVVEQVNIDGIVVWQSSTGEVYQSAPKAPLLKIFDSLCEYIG